LSDQPPFVNFAPRVLAGLFLLNTKKTGPLWVRFSNSKGEQANNELSATAVCAAFLLKQYIVSHDGHARSQRRKPSGDGRWYWEVITEGHTVIARGVTDEEPAACKSERGSPQG
jgi:hypothetical protein